MIIIVDAYVEINHYTAIVILTLLCLEDIDCFQFALHSFAFYISGNGAKLMWVSFGDN
jgi:hypothetical protein